MTVAERHRPVNPLRRADWVVETIALEQGRGLVEREHYARGSANTATFRHGLFRRDEWPLVYRGVALWIPPTRAAAEATFPEDWKSVLSLSRLAIEPDVPTNAASFLLARSVKLIRCDPRWRCLVTYADTWQGHTGAIYRAAGWEYVGETRPERVYVLDGAMIARKAGPRTRTHQEMIDIGAKMIGAYSRHKFRIVLQ